MLASARKKKLFQQRETSLPVEGLCVCVRENSDFSPFQEVLLS